jgi:hypothetical protein
VNLGLNENLKINALDGGKKYHEGVQTSETSCGQRVSPDTPDQQKAKDTLEVSKRQHQCMLCTCAFNNRKDMVQRIKKKHAGLFIECKHNGKCSQIFQTEAEKSVHILEITNKKYKLIKCEFCCLMYSIKNQAYHFKIHHTNENLIRCSYNNCSTRFRSEVEKQNHEALVHALTRRQKCIFCNLFFAEDCLFHHYQRKHKSLLAKAFRCKFKCRKYFLTEADLEEHIASAHKRPMRAEVSVCTVTKYALINTC